MTKPPESDWKLKDELRKRGYPVASFRHEIGADPSSQSSVFIRKFIASCLPKNALSLKCNYYNDSFVSGKFDEQLSINPTIAVDEVFNEKVGLVDFVLVDLPLGIPTASISVNLTESIKQDSLALIRREAAMILSITASERIKALGFLAVVATPGALCKKSGQLWLDALAARGFSLVMAIEFPANSMYGTALAPYILFFKRIAVSECGTMLARIKPDFDIDSVIDQFLNPSRFDYSDLGYWTQTRLESGIDGEEARYKLSRVAENFAGFKSWKLDDLAISLNSTKKGVGFEEIENAVYVQRYPVKSDIAMDELPPESSAHNWYQIQLKNDVRAAYLAHFFNSEVGRFAYQSAAMPGARARALNYELFTHLEIPLPDLNIQDSVLSAKQSLLDLNEQLINFSKELVLSPYNASRVQVDLHNMLGTIGALNEIDDLLRIIRDGENQKVEFKETLSLDVKSLTKEKHLEHSVLKTIAGFLNAEGGLLFIGVHDSGTVTGLQDELAKFHKGDSDKFVNKFHNLVKGRFSAVCLNKFSWAMKNIQGRQVLVVEVERSPEPCWLDKEFFRRSNPATDRLEGEALSAYLLERFGPSK